MLQTARRVGGTAAAVVLGPTAVVLPSEDLSSKVDEMKAMIKFQLKKVTCMACAVGNIEMTDDDLKTNIMMALNFLASLLKKGWHNLKSVHIKSTMGKPITVM